MTEKPLLLAIYAILGILIATWPIGRLFEAQLQVRSETGKASATSPFIRICLVTLSAAVIFGWIFGPVYALPASLFLGYLTYLSRYKPRDAGNLLGVAHWVS